MPMDPASPTTGHRVVAIGLNAAALAHARMSIENGRFVPDERNAWSEDRPSTQQEDEFIQNYGLEEYGRWYFGKNDDKRENAKGIMNSPMGTSMTSIAVLRSLPKAGRDRAPCRLVVGRSPAC
jgi:hypothetical protein